MNKIKKREPMSETVESLRTEVVEAGGIKCYEIKEVCDLLGFSSFGPYVKKDVERQLAAKGLGFQSGSKTAYVWELRGEVGALMQALKAPSPQNMDVISSKLEGGAEKELEKVERQYVELKGMVEEIGEILEKP